MPRSSSSPPRRWNFPSSGRRLPDPLPVLPLRGDPGRIGWEHGRQAREPIAHNLRLYFRRFRDEAGLSRGEVLRQAEGWLERVKVLDADFAQMVEGIAAGAGVPPSEIAALNARYELLYAAFAAQGLPTACTSCAVLPERTGGSLLLAQNWDWFPEVRGLWLRVRWGDLALLAFTEAGIAGGKIGLNSAGVGLAVNGLVSHLDRSDGEGVPFHVRTWRVLVSHDLDEATRAVEEGGSPGSAHFLVADSKAGRAISLERAPTGTARVEPVGGILVHANHFLRGEALGVREPLREERRSTFLRQERLSARLAQAAERGLISTKDVEEALRDHGGYPDSVCRHESPLFPPDLNYRTVLSVVLDLGARRLRYTPGPPCTSLYHELYLGRNYEGEGAVGCG
ncbi:MAG: C45 family peptidase [Candidatus Bipolaricaulota bacterium]|nr:C45 family peptidase [Candidatus Bipolaricaulota bacterium]